MFKNELFVSDSSCFPRKDIPFGDILNNLFFSPIEDNKDFPIHGPNVVRFIEALINWDKIKDTDNDIVNQIFKDTEVQKIYEEYYYLKDNNKADIQRALGILDEDGKEVKNKREKVKSLLKTAALFHDIGKVIRRANHSAIGVNLVRNYRPIDSEKLLDFLIFKDEDDETDKKYNRFLLITSMIQHHEKFGVVITGEGSLPLLCDILYFASDESGIKGIKKNITSVMLLNLADIAAVNITSPEAKTRTDSITLAREYRTSSEYDRDKILSELLEICKSDHVNLGLPLISLENVLEYWDILIKAVEKTKGNRVKLKEELLALERNPARAIKRILSLHHICALTANCEVLKDFMSTASVEILMVGKLGSHLFQIFCDLLSTVAKFDYGLYFFNAIMCACVRKKIYNNRYSINQPRIESKDFHEIDISYLQDRDIIQVDGNYFFNKSIKNLEDLEEQLEKTNRTEDEKDRIFTVWREYYNGDYWRKLTLEEESKLRGSQSKVKREISDSVTVLFVEVLQGLLNRYMDILGCDTPDPRRYGFQMRNLTLDSKIRDTVIDLLCIQDYREASALTWILDEVTIWSMD